MPRREKKPNQKQAMFIAEYLVDLNATAAALRAGYSPSQAQRASTDILKKPHVAAAVQKAMDARAAVVGITGAEVLRDIREVVQRCMQKVQVMGDDGEPTGEWKFEPNPSLKGLELLGKNLKLFTDVIEHKGLEGLAEKIREGRMRVASRKR
jgi:phage terminase small subunit